MRDRVMRMGVDAVEIDFFVVLVDEFRFEERRFLHIDIRFFRSHKVDMRVFDRIAHIVGVVHKDGLDHEAKEEKQIGEKHAENERGESKFIPECDADSELLQKGESMEFEARFFLFFAQIVSQKLNRPVIERFGDDEEIDDEIDDEGADGGEEEGSRV